MDLNGFCRVVFGLLSAVLLIHSNTLCNSSQDEEERKVYIVYMGRIPESRTYSLASVHSSILQEVVGESGASEALIRSYKRSFNGFAAKLTESEAKKIASREDVVLIFPSGISRLHTTVSWEFVGLNETAKRIPSVESNMIIGVLDSGVWPESKSFSDKGFGPPPKKWKGVCKGGANFICNNKIIGAQIYVDGSSSARDGLGHGTHTASTAAGTVVPGANFYGLGNGTARGGVPSARIAVYKVCNDEGACADADVLAGFDDAIADGVDIITVSLGKEIAFSFDIDTVAIGGFHAMERGILTVQSAGNSGPVAGTVSSVAPWLFSVGAGTTDRSFKTIYQEKWTWETNTINAFPSMKKNVSVVYGGQVTSECSEELGGECNPTCLDSKKVSGKIVICQSKFMDNINEALSKGAAGVISQCSVGNPFPEPFVTPLPLICFDESNLESFLAYFNATNRNVTGRMLKSEETKAEYIGHTIAAFSSRGPNKIVADIRKPDIVAPGLNILAAYSPLASPSGSSFDKRSVNYTFLSGTSMSAPHVAGAAAYVKSFHPDWSPAAIKSALMTTATPMRELADPSGIGSGYINPADAVDPGLVFDINKEDYLSFLCNLQYQLGTISSNKTAKCPKGSEEMTPAKLNYPALVFQIPNVKSFAIGLNRTVTNVGLPDSVYRVLLPQIDPQLSLKIDVLPKVLRFKSLGEKQTFEVVVSGVLLLDQEFKLSIIWADGQHKVTIPIAIYTAPQ